MRISRIWLKALGLFLVVALVPIAVAAALLLPSYGRAVRLNEQQYQLVVVKEATAAVERHITAPQLDAVSVADALAEASSEPMRERAADALGAVRAVLQSRPNIDAVRFEVPEAKVSTVLLKRGAEPADVPSSTPELRSEADQRGVAFKVADAGRAIVVVPIPRVAGPAAAAPPKGYVTAAVYLAPLGDELRAIAEARALVGEGTGIMIVDGERRLVARYPAVGLEPGADTSALPIWRMLPAGIPHARPVGAQDDYLQDAVPMIGSVQTVRNVGWAVALWRPENVVLADYHAMRRLGATIGLGALLGALVLGWLTARAITRPVLQMARHARLIGQRAWKKLPAPSQRADELGELSRSLGDMAGELQASEAEIARQAKLRGDLSRFVSKELVDAIVSGKHSLALGGTRQPVTVLFADFVAFTPLAEGRAPEHVVSMLNELFTVLTEVVFRHGGMVDKFIGDCVMGVWGAPVPHADHAARALAAAEDMMRFLEVGAEQWRDKYDVEVRLAIGVNSGDAIVGNIGSDKRMEYTVVGDAVNVAARLETIAAPNQVLVGEATAALVGAEFELRLLGGRKLTGRQTEIKIYELQTS